MTNTVQILLVPLISSVLLLFLIFLFSPMLFIQNLFEFPWVVLTGGVILVLVSIGYYFLPEEGSNREGNAFQEIQTD